MQKPEALPAAVAAEITGYMKAAGMTQKRLAEATSMHEKTVGRLLRNQREIDIRVIALFAQVLNFEPSELFDRAEKRVSRSSE